MIESLASRPRPCAEHPWGYGLASQAHTRHDLPTDGLAVEATFDMGAKPARVAGIDLRLIVPEGVPPERLAALLAVASHCTVHNTLTSEPDISISLADAPAR